MAKTFVAIGFGPIQSGLFLLEAQASANFERLVAVEVVPETVSAVRRSGGRYWVNVAEPHGIRSTQIAGVEIYNPLDAADVASVVDAIAAADEVATALPSVESYTRGSPSPAELLARGFQRKLADNRLPQTVVYAAENHNRAAERMRDSVLPLVEPADRPRLNAYVQFVNTVIGKMSGVVTDAQQIRRDGLAPLVEGSNRAVLVEQFNRILVNRIRLAGITRGIEVFEEKEDLLPFEEAKLYGHNAAHALLGYLANRQGLTFIHEADPAGLLKLVEQAFLDESGGALCRRHAGVDPLFTSTGWAEYVQDLMVRMVNPFLRDRVDRVIRDTQRKLGWDDRLIGTMRLAIEHDIVPRHYALGAAAAAELLLAEQPQQTISSLLTSIWPDRANSQASRKSIINCIRQAGEELHQR